MTPTALPSTTLTTQSFRTNQPNQQQFLSAYEEKQRQLEHQILFLQAKQREQEELIRRHNLLQEQQNRQQFIDQRLRLQQNEQENFFRQQQQQQLQQQQNFQSNQQQQQNFQSNQQQQFRSNQQNFDSNQQNFQSNQQNFDSNQQNFQSNQQNFINPPKNQVLQAPPTTNNIQFIESVPVGHTVGISVEQQLPFKGPVEFNPDNPDRQKTFTQLQQQYQHKQQQKQSQNQQQIFQKANQQFNQNFNQQTNQQNQNFNNNNQQNQNFNQNFQNQGFQQNNQQQPSAQALIQKQEVQEFSFLPQLTLNQELPNRQAGAFIPQFTPLPTGLELPLRAYQTFNSSPLTVLPSLTDIAQPSEARNRVFRQDAGQTGNFGINDQQQQQINHQQQQQFNPNESALDSQLQNLLLQSGLSTRSAEDFRIISKVLALNHGVPNNLFFNDNRF